MKDTLSADEFREYILTHKHSIKPSPHLTAGEAAFLLSTMPEDALAFLRTTPRHRLQGEPANAYLVRRTLQRQLKKETPQ